MASEHTTEMTRLGINIEFYIKDIWECIKMIRDMDKVSIMILILNSIKLNEIN